MKDKVDKIIEGVIRDVLKEDKRKLKDEVKSLMNKKIPINLDFDGTCVVHNYPHIGKENEHCVEVLKKWIKDYNVGLILHTSRGSKEELDPVKKWFKDRDIELWGVGKNPTQDSWCKSNKSYGYFIDDMCVGIPLIDEDGERPRVDWKEIDRIFTPRLKKLNGMQGN